MLKEIGVNHGAAALPRDATENTKLRKVCADFESMFLAYMMKEMKLASSGFEKDGRELPLSSVFNEKIAVHFARSGGTGLGKLLFESLRSCEKTSTDDDFLPIE
jgi:Rod binding domain-containing protein